MTQNQKINFSVFFNQQVEQAPHAIKISFQETLELFLEDPFQESLRNHPLRGKYAGCRSIDVTSDWRAVYRVTEKRNTVSIYFIALGIHEQLYAK